jgi:hypothetical protein
MKLEIETLLEQIVSPSYAWGPSSTFVQLKGMAELLGRQRISLHGKTCIDFGCGAARPLSVASVMYLLGADNTLSVDTAPPIDEALAATGVYALILAALSGRIGIDTTRLGVTPRALRERCAAFDLARLLKGDLRGMPSSVRLRTGDYLALSIPERGFDFLTSYSVLEHVQDLSFYLRGFRASISDAGAIFVAIDYRDHRRYTVQASMWQYLLDDGDHAPGYINKIRHTEFVRLIGEAGFTIAECHTVHQDPSQQELVAFLPRYRDMSREDITVTEAHLLLVPK